MFLIGTVRSPLMADRRSYYGMARQSSSTTLMDRYMIWQPALLDVFLLLVIGWQGAILFQPHPWSTTTISLSLKQLSKKTKPFFMSSWKMEQRDRLATKAT